MFDLVILLCRYLFVGYIAVFLLAGAACVLSERGLSKIRAARALAVQRVATVFTHLTAFLILAYIPDTFYFRSNILTTGALGLLFLFLGRFAAEKAYRGGCPLMWNGVFFLLDAGLITLTRLDPALALKQLVWFAVGLASALLIPTALKFVPRFENLEKAYLAASFALLAAPLVLGARTHGALNWIELWGVRFQPSELVKFLYVFYLASVFRKKRAFTELLAPTAASVALVGILAAANDLGGALIFFMTYMMNLYIATGDARLFLLGMGSAAAASAGAYRALPHIRTRVAAWQNPWADIYGGGNQLAHSLFAISAGGLFGSGLTRGMPLAVPVVKSDFIFAAVCEEFGAAFGVGLVGVFMLVFYRGVHVALRCNRRYYALLAAGFTSMLAFQAFLIIGGVTKLIPLTGVTLPFISYGGSSIVVSILMIGILQWVYIYNKNEEIST